MTLFYDLCVFVVVNTTRAYAKVLVVLVLAVSSVLAVQYLNTNARSNIKKNRIQYHFWMSCLISRLEDEYTDRVY